MKYLFTQVRMAIIKKKKNLQTINAGEGVESRESSYIVDGNVNLKKKKKQKHAPGWVKNKLQYTIKSQHKRYFHNDYLSLSGDFENHIESQILQKKVQSATQLHSFHTLARLCSTSFKLGFNSMWTETFQMCKLGLEKAGEPEINLPTSVRS